MTFLILYTYEMSRVDHPWLVVSLSLLFKLCILFRIRVVYDIEKETPGQSFWGSTFMKRKKN
jgi:hypothetical protein